MTQVGHTKFTGSAPPNSAVQIVDDDGSTIATTKADSNGDFVVRSVALEVGRHEIHAVAFAGIGRRSHSPTINITVEAATDNDADDDEVADVELSEVASRYYAELVETTSQGFVVDLDLAVEVLELCGRSIDEFETDVARLREMSERDEAARERIRSFLGD